MAYAHYQLKANVGSTVEVDTDGELRLLDDDNYRRFQHGEACKYLYGNDDPNRVTVPSAGTWHVVVSADGDQQPRVRSLSVTASHGTVATPLATERSSITSSPEAEREVLISADLADQVARTETGPQPDPQSVG